MHIHNSTAHDWKRRRRGGGATPRHPAAGHWRNHCRSSRHRRHSAAGRWDREAVEERRGAPGSGGLLMGDGAMRATSCRIVRHDVDVWHPVTAISTSPRAAVYRRLVVELGGRMRPGAASMAIEEKYVRLAVPQNGGDATPCGCRATNQVGLPRSFTCSERDSHVQ